MSNSRVKPLDWLHKSVRRELLDRDLELVRDHLAGRVLEIGAGSKGRRGAFKIPKLEEWVYLDLSEKSQPHVRADVMRLPFPREYFDTLVCLEVFEYVENPLLVLVEIQNVLKPDGSLVLSTPFFHRTDTPVDRWRFTEPGLRFLFAQTNMAITRFFTQGGAHATLINTLKQLIRVRSLHQQKWLAIGARPLFEAILRQEQKHIKKFPLLASFSTGFLVLAKKEK